MANTVNDITINLYDPSGKTVASQDLATSPEVLMYAPGEAIPAGTWNAEVCPFDGPDVPLLPPFNYVGVVSTSDSAGPTTGGGGLGAAYNPKYRFFPANPTLDSPTQTPRNAVVGCWIQVSGCTLPTGEFRNVQAFAPWDVLTSTGLSTNTTAGNNALTREAWASPLTPGGLAQAPISATGDYRLPFTDAWNNSRCNPAELVPGGNDINFASPTCSSSTTGCTTTATTSASPRPTTTCSSTTAAAAVSRTTPRSATSRPAPSAACRPVLGRDNANQIALQDGVPGITNQYLFQPIAGAFYSPCTDGGLDMGIVGHEYTHAISNRMVGGPDEGLTSEQGGAMGESWSDQVAAEFQFSHGYSNGGNVFAVGAYATGNKTVAIRDFSINKNPLNYSDYGFDTTGPEVHADGEIWNGTQWEVRSALVKKYDKQFPYANKALQLRCAQGTTVASPLRADKCPGNRRWVQLLFDSFLLQQGATTMLDARDAMIASDQMRFERRQQEDPVGRLRPPRHGRRRHGRRRRGHQPHAELQVHRRRRRQHDGPFKVRKPAPRSSWATSWPGPPRSPTPPRRPSRTNVASFTPGSYDMLLRQLRHGFMRFNMTVRPGKRAQVVRVRTTKNYSSAPSGAKIIRSTSGSRQPAFLIDGTEATGWGVATAKNVDQSRPSIDVDLAGKKPVVIRTVAVSALLRPPFQADRDAGSRFTAVRKFAVEACVKACATPRARWKRVSPLAEQRVPVLASPPGRADPQHAGLRHQADEGRRPAPGRPGEPVHRVRRLRR